MPDEFARKVLGSSLKLWWDTAYSLGGSYHQEIVRERAGHLWNALIALSSPAKLHVSRRHLLLDFLTFMNYSKILLPRNILIFRKVI